MHKRKSRAEGEGSGVYLGTGQFPILQRAVGVGLTELETFDQDLKEVRGSGRWIYGTKVPFGKKELSDEDSSIETCLEFSGNRKEASARVLRA